VTVSSDKPEVIFLSIEFFHARGGLIVVGSVFLRWSIQSQPLAAN